MLRNIKYSVRAISTLFVAISCSLSAYASASKEVNIYSARKEALIKPLLDNFTKETGIKVNLVTGKGDALLTRLASEGKNSPADILVTTDVGRLHRAKEAGVLQSFSTPTLNSIVPANYRDKEGYWYGLSLRARVIVYAKDRVKPEELSTYAALADPKWKRRICVRSSGNIYNQSLVASFIHNSGKEATEKWLSGFVANFARPPRGGDRDQIKAVAAGRCDIAVVNSYYFGAMLRSTKDSESLPAQKVALFWPNQSNEGTHINISGAGITRASKNKENALKLLDYLTSEQSQQWYAEVNNEFPVREGIPASKTLKSWGSFKADPLPVYKLGLLNAAALKAMDRARWK